MKTFIISTVGACLLLPIIGAGAQPPDVTPGALARFKVEAVSFNAIDETGWFDWTGSDEVFVAIHVPDRKITTFSQVFRDVDSGERRDIPSDQNCILPIAGVTGPRTLAAGGGRSNPGDRWSCSNDGAPGPISFRFGFTKRTPATLSLLSSPWVSGAGAIPGTHSYPMMI